MERMKYEGHELRSLEIYDFHADNINYFYCQKLNECQVKTPMLEILKSCFLTLSNAVKTNLCNRFSVCTCSNSHKDSKIFLQLICVEDAYNSMFGIKYKVCNAFHLQVNSKESCNVTPNALKLI